MISLLEKIVSRNLYDLKGLFQEMQVRYGQDDEIVWRWQIERSRIMYVKHPLTGRFTLPNHPKTLFAQLLFARAVGRLS